MYFTVTYIRRHYTSINDIQSRHNYTRRHQVSKNTYGVNDWIKRELPINPLKSEKMKKLIRTSTECYVPNLLKSLYIYARIYIYIHIDHDINTTSCINTFIPLQLSKTLWPHVKREKDVIYL